MILNVLILACALVCGVALALGAVIDIHIVVVPAEPPLTRAPVIGSTLAAARARRGWDRCSPFTGVLNPPITTPPPPPEVLAEFLAVTPDPYIPPPPERRRPMPFGLFNYWPQPPEMTHVYA